MPGQKTAAVTAPMGHLTGSMCDSVGSVRPVNYLDWPCVAPVGETALIVEERLAVDLGRSYGSITHPRVRLIATDHQHNGYAYAQWWDADHPETPVQFIELDGPGTSYGDTPTADTDLIMGQQVLFVRSGTITSVTLEPSGKALPLRGGVADVPDLGNVALENATTLVARDSSGQTKPLWSLGLSTGLADTSAAERICDSHAGVGTCSPDPNYSMTNRRALPTGDCTTPDTPPADYLSWPCSIEADATTPARVSAAVTHIVATRIGVSQPRARLLADSRDAGTPAGHVAASLVEVWDAASKGPAVLVMVTGKPGGIAVQVITDHNTPAGNPAVDVENDNAIAAVVEVDFVFTRRDVTAVHYAASKAKPSTAQTTSPIGGVTSLSIPDETGTQTIANGAITATTRDNQTVYFKDFNGENIRIGCATTAVYGSTCVPQLPSDLPPPDAVPAAGASSAVPRS